MYPSIEDTSRTLHRKLLNLIDREFKKYWPSLDGSVWKGVCQNKFDDNTPYFSRVEFERMILHLPNGYDTNVFELHTIGKIQKNNEQFIEELFEDKDNVSS